MPHSTPSERAPSESSSIYSFRLNPVEIRVGLIALALGIVARFQALLPGYSIDDYVFVNQGLPPWFDPTSAAGGRALSYAMYAALARLGAAPPRASVFFIVLLTLALIVTGLAAARLWRLSNQFGASLIVVGFVVLHPYQAEMFTFRTASMIIAIPLLLSVGAIVLCDRSRKNWLWSLIAVTAAISIYQAVLNYLALILLFEVAYELIQPDRRFKEWFPRLRSQILIIIASLVLYALSTTIVVRLTHVGLGSRAAAMGLSEISTRAQAAATFAYRMLALNEPVFPAATKAILILLFAGCFAAFLIGRKPAKTRRTLVLIGAAFAGAPLCFGIILVMHEWAPSPRVLSQTSLYCAGLMAMLYLFSGVQARRWMAAGCALIFLSFIGINDQVFADQLRVNMRDMAEANRIMMRIEQLPGFAQMRSVAIIGGTWGYASAIGTVQNDMNVSALFVEWAKVGLLNEASGYAFNQATPEAKLKAVELCKTTPKWPAAESVTAVESTAIVCLPN